MDIQKLLEKNDKLIQSVINDWINYKNQYQCNHIDIDDINEKKEGRLKNYESHKKLASVL